MIVTLNQARLLLSASLNFAEEEVVVYGRRLRELGLLPEGKGGRGEDASAPIEPEHALMLFFALMTGEPPKRAPRTAIQFGQLRMSGGLHVANDVALADGSRRLDHLEVMDAVRPPTLWTVLLGWLASSRQRAEGGRLDTIDFTQEPARLYARTDVWLPNDDYRSITFASRELDAGESWRRRRTVMAEGKVIEGLVGLFGYSDTAAAEMTSTRESVRRFYERTEGLARGEAE